MHSASVRVHANSPCGDRLGCSLGTQSNGMAGPPVAVNSVQPTMDGLQHTRVSIFNHVLEVMPHGHQFLELGGGQPWIGQQGVQLGYLNASRISTCICSTAV